MSDTNQDKNKITSNQILDTDPAEPETDGSVEEEIDAYAQALLDKKTEMAIYTEVMGTEEQKAQPMNTAEISERIMSAKEVENTMADALDELRRERGQVPIDQEEEDFAWSQTAPFEDMDADFTTESLFKKESAPASSTVISGYNAAAQQNYLEQTEKRPVKKKKSKSRPGKNKSSDVQESTKVKEDRTAADVSLPKLPVTTEEKPEIRSEKMPEIPEDADAQASQSQKARTEPADHASALKENKKDSGTDSLHDTRKNSVMQSVYVEEQQKQEHKSHTLRNVIIVTVIGLLCVLAGIFYKTQIYDPAHTATPEQQKIYETLATYADQYDSLSAGQKKDLAAMLSQYSDMTETQKNELNNYFKEKTGSTFVEIAAGINDAAKENQDQKDDESNTSDQNDSQNNDQNDSSASGSEPVTSDTSDSTSSAVPSVPESQSGSSTAPSGTNPAPATESTGNNAAVIAQYEQEIAQLQTDRSNYVDFLASEGLPTSDDITASYDAQIAYYQNLLNSLQ